LEEKEKSIPKTFPTKRCIGDRERKSNAAKKNQPLANKGFGRG